MAEKKWLVPLIMIGLIFVVLFNSEKLDINKSSSFASLPNDLKLTREQFPLFYEFRLNDGNNLIQLNEGIDLDNLLKIEILARGCWNDQGQNTQNENINFNGKSYSY